MNVPHFTHGTESKDCPPRGSDSTQTHSTRTAAAAETQRLDIAWSENQAFDVPVFGRASRLLRALVPNLG